MNIFFCAPTVNFVIHLPIWQFYQCISVLGQQLPFCQPQTEFGGLCCFWRFGANTTWQRWVFQPAEGLGGGRVVQGSTACLVRLVDLSASAHQGHSALVPPISSRIVQRCPTGKNARTENRVTLNNRNGTWITVTASLKRKKKTQASNKVDSKTHLPIMSLLFKSVPLLKSKFRHSTFL